MLTSRDVAERFGVSKRAVTRWIQHGLLPASRLGNQYMIDPSDVDNFVPVERNYVKDWDEHLEYVARIYRNAKAAGQSPRTAIADIFDCSRSGTVDRWLLLARERGYLDRSEP